MSFALSLRSLLRSAHNLIGFVVGVSLSAVCLHHARAAVTGGPALMVSASSIAQGSNVNLSAEGELDWVHWGLYTETSLDRKAGVVPQIGDFTVLYDSNNSNAYAYVYQYADNFNGYSWRDGTPTAAITNTTTGVWTYGIPTMGTGFQITAPADTAPRTLKVYAGAYAAHGKFVAFLSDGSARGYTNTTAVFNMTSGPSWVFTINYAAASPTQLLVVRWTLEIADRPDGNVTLQAATLDSTNVNNSPFVALMSPANNSSFAAGANVTLTATANDSDGTVAKVEFFEGTNKLGEATATPPNPYNFSWNNVPPGNYALTARATDNQGGTSVSAPVEIFVNGTGGSLAGTLATPLKSVNLTSEGTRDWAHWGLATNSVFNHKANVVQQISDFTKIGTDTAKIYKDNYTAFSWSDGTPTITASSVTDGVFTTGVTNGFQITVPADTTPRRLRIYVGLYGAQGNFQAWLSDFSAAAYLDTTLSNSYQNVYGVYTLNYAAVSSGQTLTVRYRSLKLFDFDFGNVTLQAATLVVNPGTNAPQAVTLVNPIWSENNFVFSFQSEAGRTYDLDYTATLGSGTWTTFDTVPGTGSTITVTNRNPTDLQRFYRVGAR